MKLTFKITYFTHWGENMYITGNAVELGAGDIKKAVPMNFTPSEDWSLEVNLKAQNLDKLQYSYFIKDENSDKITPEWNAQRVVNLSIPQKQIVLIDAWNSISAIENNFLTSPFQNVLFRSHSPTPSQSSPSQPSPKGRAFEVLQVAEPVKTSHSLTSPPSGGLGGATSVELEGATSMVLGGLMLPIFSASKPHY